jgi:hypothetical protein
VQKSVALVTVVVFALLGAALVDVPRVEAAPLVPQFTLQIVDRSYDVAPTFTIDPFTGSNMTSNGGFHVEKRFINVVITNPTPLNHLDSNGNIVKTYFFVRAKGHFGDWSSGSLDPDADSKLQPSDGQYTTIPFGFGQNNPGGFSIFLGYIAPGGQVDFQVETLEGYYTTVQSTPGLCNRIEQYSVFAQSGLSGWSDTQTVTIDPLPTATPTLQPPSTPSPSAKLSPGDSLTPIPSSSSTFTPRLTTQPIGYLNASQFILPVVIAVAVVIAIAVAALLRWKKKVTPTQNAPAEYDGAPPEQVRAKPENGSEPGG